MIERRSTQVEHFVDRAIRAAVAPHASDGIVSEVVESSALVARRAFG